MDDFEPTKSLIGKGQFGEVYKIVSKIDKKEYAIKYINIDPHNATKDIQKSFMRELFILYHLKHPAIVQFKGGNLNSSDNPTVFHPSIVTEYLPNGSLNDFINNTKLNSTQKLIILLGISSAMKYVHKENVIHRDLKPDNILLDKNLYPRICDFGLSRFFDTSSKQAKTIEMSFMIGTPLYFSPEKMKDGHVYGPSSDVYAFSLIAYFVVTGLSPFYEQKFLNIFNLFNYVYEQKGRPQFLDDTVSEKMKLLLSRCWDHEPLKRPNFDEIFHELSTDFSYFNDEIDKEKVEEYLRILHEEVYDYPNDLATQNAQLKINVDNLNKEIKEILKKQESFSSVNEDGINLLNVLYKYVSNKKETIDILTNMSSNGNSCASYLLGLINEKISGNKINFTQIQPFYEKTSEQGNSFGYFRLGCLYNKIENFEKAIEFFVKASQMGNTDSLFYIGSIYKLQKKYPQAIEYYKKAAEKKDSGALNQLGNFYQWGYGVEIDYQMAEKYFQQSAELGNPTAYVNLSFLYMNCFNGIKNKDEIIGCIQKACDLNDPDAFKVLASMYEKGFGNIQQNMNLAIKYYKKSAKLGCKEAKKKLDELKK